jgi:hypothetical protein
MFWILFFLLAFGFGLGMWEHVALKECVRQLGYVSNSWLPRTFHTKVFQAWKWAGQLGFFAVAIAGWWFADGFLSGLLRSLGYEAIYVAIGSAVGLGIWNALGGSAPSQRPPDTAD